MKFIDKAELVKSIDAWGKRGVAWAKDGQVIALSCLKQLADHGDVGFVNRLYLSMPKGTKSSAMASWLLTHGALVANTDRATKATKPFAYTKDKQTDLAAASADPWFDHKPEPAADAVFDLQKALVQVLKKANGKELVHAELLEGIRALVGDELAAEAGVTKMPEGEDAPV